MRTVETAHWIKYADRLAFGFALGAVFAREAEIAAAAAGIIVIVIAIAVLFAVRFVNRRKTSFPICDSFADLSQRILFFRSCLGIFKRFLKCASFHLFSFIKRYFYLP